MDLQAKAVQFLRLPPETRNQIYHHVLSEPQGLSLNSLQRPALLTTCRQIQQEASPVFFSSNHFEFSLNRSHPCCDPNSDPGRDPKIIFRPSTGNYFRNMQAYMTHIVHINVHATVLFHVWYAFFTTFRIEVQGGRVHIKLDVNYQSQQCSLRFYRFQAHDRPLNMAAQSMVESSSRRTTPPHFRHEFESEAATIEVKALRQKTIVEDRPLKPVFLDLSGELRNVIYHLVLEEITCDLILNLHDFRIPIPKLALVCKQIFREVLSVQFTKDDSEFYWQGHASGGDLNFSITQTPMLSEDTRRWAERCAMLGAPLNFKHLVFHAPVSHGTQPSIPRRTCCIHVENGTARVESQSAFTERDCAEILKNNMSKELSEIMHQHKTKLLGILELEAFRLLLGRFNLHEHFRGRSLLSQALMSNDPEMIRSKATYLGCHLDTHPWGYYTERNKSGMHGT